MSPYQTAIEEIACDGVVSLGNCSISTLRRWAGKCNEILRNGGYGWRVAFEPDGRILRRVSLG